MKRILILTLLLILLFTVSVNGATAAAYLSLGSRYATSSGIVSETIGRGSMYVYSTSPYACTLRLQKASSGLYFTVGDPVDAEPSTSASRYYGAPGNFRVKLEPTVSKQGFANGLVRDY